jgi:FlaA1/EpsC-like NDP-sugar epimerase
MKMDNWLPRVDGNSRVFSVGAAVAPEAIRRESVFASLSETVGSRRGVLSAELVLAGLSYLLSVLVLFRGPARAELLWSPAVFIVLAFRWVSLCLVGPYRSSLRHAGIHELLDIAKAVTLSSLPLFLFVREFEIAGVARTPALFVLDWALCQLFLGGLHFAGPVIRSQQSLWRRSGKRVAVVGAGDAGMTLVKELASDPDSHYRPTAIFDDNPRTHGIMICGVPVIGSTDCLTSAAKTKSIDEVLICIPSATRSEMSRLFTVCCRLGLPVRTLPTLAEIVDGKVSQRDLRNLRIEDLLHREELVSDPAEVAEIVGEHVVLITGAGGSIGSELSRQIAKAKPKKLLLLDKTENSLFYIERELREQFSGLATTPCLVDVTLRDCLDRVYQQHKPSLVFHAAAYKHVGLLELHPSEAIRNNVLGTRNVALAALEHGAEKFVNISTDKAVNPENYMGLSKKLTELYIQHLSSTKATRFMNVRFGNVAGSTGSVLRLFWDHIQKGEPLHVTDPRATRFFMSIPEAVHLILRAAGQGRGGETFVLEMGDPINIYELAKSMSLLAGFAPGKELPIHFVGLRGGEKVTEELWSSWEHPKPSAHNGILVITEKDFRASNILQTIEELEQELRFNSGRNLHVSIERLFPSFGLKRASDSQSAEPQMPGSHIRSHRGHDEHTALETEYGRP